MDGRFIHCSDLSVESVFFVRQKFWALILIVRPPLLIEIYELMGRGGLRFSGLAGVNCNTAAPSYFWPIIPPFLVSVVNAAPRTNFSPVDPRGVLSRTVSRSVV